MPSGTYRTYGKHTVVYRDNGWYDPFTGFFIISALSDDDDESSTVINNYYSNVSEETNKTDSGSSDSSKDNSLPMGFEVVGLGVLSAYLIIARRN